MPVHFLYAVLHQRSTQLHDKSFTSAITVTCTGDFARTCCNTTGTCASGNTSSFVTRPQQWKQAYIHTGVTDNKLSTSDFSSCRSPELRITIAMNLTLHQQHAFHNTIVRCRRKCRRCLRSALRATNEPGGSPTSTTTSSTSGTSVEAPEQGMQSILLVRCQAQVRHHNLKPVKQCD